MFPLKHSVTTEDIYLYTLACFMLQYGFTLEDIYTRDMSIIGRKDDLRLLLKIDFVKHPFGVYLETDEVLSDWAFKTLEEYYRFILSEYWSIVHRMKMDSLHFQMEYPRNTYEISVFPAKFLAWMGDNYPDARRNLGAYNDYSKMAGLYTDIQMYSTDPSTERAADLKRLFFMTFAFIKPRVRKTLIDVTSRTRPQDPAIVKVPLHVG